VISIVRNHRSRMPESFWHKACTDAVARQKEHVAITLGSVLVSCVSVLQKCLLRVMLQQSTACLICTVASGYMLRRWWRLDDYDRARIWKHYGMFSGLMCFGSCAGAVSYAAICLFFDSFYKSFTDGEFDYSVYPLVRFVLLLLCKSSALGCTRWRVVHHA
jgi:hypothetical protein